MIARAHTSLSDANIALCHELGLYCRAHNAAIESWMDEQSGTNDTGTDGAVQCAVEGLFVSHFRGSPEYAVLRVGVVHSCPSIPRLLQDDGCSQCVDRCPITARSFGCSRCICR